jgi:hypothetical protein
MKHVDDTKAVQGTPHADDVQPVSVDVNSRHISVAANMETARNTRVNDSAALLEEELHSKKVSSVCFECDDAVTQLNVAANQGTNTVPADVKHTNKEVLQEDRIGMEVPVLVTQLAQCSTQQEVTI